MVKKKHKQCSVKREYVNVLADFAAACCGAAWVRAPE